LHLRGKILETIAYQVNNGVCAIVGKWILEAKELVPDGAAIKRIKGKWQIERQC
jgi:hypothetical protein